MLYCVKSGLNYVNWIFPVTNTQNVGIGPNRLYLDLRLVMNFPGFVEHILAFLLLSRLLLLHYLIFVTYYLLDDLAPTTHTAKHCYNYTHQQNYSRNNNTHNQPHF